MNNDEAVRIGGWITLLLFWACWPATSARAGSLSGGDLELQFDAEGRVTAVSVSGRSLQGAGDTGGLAVRDVTNAGAATEYLLNASFEGTLDGWEIPPQSQAVNIAPSQTHAREGQWSAYFQVDSSATASQFAALVSRVLAVEPGTRLRLQALYLADRGYLSQDSSWQRAVYEPGFHAVNGLGFFWTDADGTLDPDAFQFVAPFAKQAENWKPAGGECVVPPDVHYLRVAIVANLDPKFDFESFYVDAVKLFESPAALTPVVGTMTSDAEGMIFAGDRGPFHVDARWRSTGDAVEVRGQVSVDDGRDHALDLVVALPIDADGWTWPDSADKRRTIVGGYPLPYANDVSGDIQAYLPISLYPFGGVHDTLSGVAASVPLQPITMNLIRYDAVRRMLDVVFHFGLAPEVGKRSAQFTARFHAFAPSDGFRGIIDTYASSWADHPDWFESAFDVRPFRNFSVGQFMGEEGARASAENDATQTMSVQYTVADFTIPQVCPASETPPTLEQLFGIIDERAASTDPEEAYYYTWVAQQVGIDGNGDPLLKYIDQQSWTGDWVEGVLKINPSPTGVQDGMHTYTATWRLEPAFEDTSNPDPTWDVPASTLDAVQLDNFLASASLDTDPDRLERSSQPLTYSMKDYTPGLPQAAGMDDYLAWLRNWLDDHVEQPPVRGILINWKGLGIANGTLPWIDICASEVDDAVTGGQYGNGTSAWNAFDPEILFYERTLAFHKLRGMAFAGSGITRQDAVDTVETSLLYAIATGFKDETSFVRPFEQSDANELTQTYNGLVVDLHEAGWQPLTRAHASADVAIERYGDPEDDLFYLVVHNPGDQPVSATVVLDADLNVTWTPEVVERISGDTLEVGGSSPEWTVEIQQLGPRRSLMLEFSPEGPSCAYTGSSSPFGTLAILLLWIPVLVVVYKKRAMRRHRLELPGNLDT